MRHLGRYIFNGVTLLSLLVCVAAVFIWIRGVRRADVFQQGRNGYHWSAQLASGKAVVQRERDPAFPNTPVRWYSHKRQRGEDPVLQVWIGPPRQIVVDRDKRLPGLWFRSLQTSYWLGATTHTSEITVSYWLIVLVTLILPVSRVCFRKRTVPGHCRQCGYDLRATPKRCPECGHVPVGATKKGNFATENTEHTEEE